MTIFKTLYWRVINATRYSLQGMKSAYQSEMAFRLDLIIFGVNTIVLFFIHNPYFTQPERNAPSFMAGMKARSNFFDI